MGGTSQSADAIGICLRAMPCSNLPATISLHDLDPATDAREAAIPPSLGLLTSIAIRAAMMEGIQPEPLETPPRG